MELDSFLVILLKIFGFPQLVFHYHIYVQSGEHYTISITYCIEYFMVQNTNPVSFSRSQNHYLNNFWDCGVKVRRNRWGKSTHMNLQVMMSNPYLRPK